MSKKWKHHDCCAKCGTKKRRTEHHIYPKRWNKDKLTAFPADIRFDTIILCRPCHNEIEHVLNTLENFFGRLPTSLYKYIADRFCSWGI
jgi:hypothetical protein